MSETSVFCRECENIIGPNIIDTKKPCYHILITKFSMKKPLGYHEDSFMLCEKDFLKIFGTIFKKVMPKLGICKNCKKNKNIDINGFCKKCKETKKFKRTYL